IVSSALLLALVAGCNGSSPTDTDGPVAFIELYRDQNSGIASGGVQIIARQDQWEHEWDEITGTRVPKPPLPAVDIDHNLVVRAARDNTNDSCKQPRIEKIEHHSQMLDVSLLETRPPASCACPPVIVRPVHVVSVPRPVAGAPSTLHSVTE